MSVPSTTVGELKAHVAGIISNRHKGIGESEDLQIKEAIQLAIMEFLSETNSACLHADGYFTTATTQADPSTYDLADDFHIMVGESVRQSTSPYIQLEYLPQERYDMEWGRYRGTSSTNPTHFMLRRRNAQTGCQTITLAPTPGSNVTYVYRYVSVPMSIAFADDSVQIDPRIPLAYRDALVMGAVTYMSRYQNTQTDLSVFHDKWTRFLASAKESSQPIVGVPIARVPYRGRTNGPIYPTAQPNSGFVWS